ncbi:hypothetical protein F2P81_022674 [Scophthalmus maximus]|uniref:Uncharacterized protein n=1 Tax=Scophthalmus maximus TaxID=52904 RepID=A0A6A4RUV4_SCOMX|nr:hypothetical protein F2P81_022674 [Scophthalmus maximus]
MMRVGGGLQLLCNGPLIPSVILQVVIVQHLLTMHNLHCKTTNILRYEMIWGKSPLNDVRAAGDGTVPRVFVADQKPQVVMKKHQK